MHHAHSAHACSAAQLSRKALARLQTPGSTTHIAHRSIQQQAATALGRLANYSDDLAEAVVKNEILPQLVSGRWRLWGQGMCTSTARATRACARPDLLLRAPQGASAAAAVPLHRASCMLPKGGVRQARGCPPTPSCRAVSHPLTPHLLPPPGVLPGRAEPLLQEGCCLLSARCGQALTTAGAGVLQKWWGGGGGTAP